jgi:hypothetical protein
MSKAPVTQPKFDARISKLVYPLMGGRAPGHGTLKRGFMVWDKPLVGYSGLATVHFLYNPSTVEADYPIADSTVGAILQFPNPHDKADLRVPLQQTASWSLLFDRTYELWGSADHPGESPGKNNNDPSVIGVLADVFQMQQFTGMLVSYSQGTNPVVNPGGKVANFAGHQGIIQIVPSWVYFGDKSALSFYGYISEWDLQVTHWTQQMVPMRCVINITFTMLPPVSASKPGSNADTNWVALHTRIGPSVGGATTATPVTSGISGR